MKNNKTLEEIYIFADKLNFSRNAVDIDEYSDHYEVSIWNEYDYYVWTFTDLKEKSISYQHTIMFI